jgi:hypothetical protein
MKRRIPGNGKQTFCPAGVRKINVLFARLRDLGEDEISAPIVKGSFPMKRFYEKDNVLQNVRASVIL